MLEHLKMSWRFLSLSSFLPEEEEEQKIENLFEQIMKENFSYLAKEIDFQEIQEAQSPKEAGPNEAHTKAHHNYTSQN